jgi:3-deoxy-D-manno-octulosonic-acid transferase
VLDDTFARLVAEEVKNRVTDEQKDYLHLPENWGKWQRALIALNDNLASQLDGLAAQEAADTNRYRSLGDDGIRLLAESLSEYEHRRKKIVRFKFHVDARLDEVTRMIALGTDAVDERLKTVDFLRKAIEKHQFLLEG